MDTKKYHEMFTELRNASGVYLLYGNNGLEPAYVGKSTQLGRRIDTSCQTKEVFSFKVILLDNKSDMDILEVYLIAKWKPIYNKDCKRDYSPTIDLGVIETISRRYVFENIPLIRDVVEWNQYKIADIALEVAMEHVSDPRFDDPLVRVHMCENSGITTAHRYVEWLNSKLD